MAAWRGSGLLALSAAAARHEAVSWPEVFLGSLCFAIGGRTGDPGLVGLGVAVTVFGAATIVGGSFGLAAVRARR